MGRAEAHRGSVSTLPYVRVMPLVYRSLVKKGVLFAMENTGCSGSDLRSHHAPDEQQHSVSRLQISVTSQSEVTLYRITTTSEIICLPTQ